MSSIADILLAALYFVGHLELMLAGANRWVVRIRDRPAKSALFVAYTLAWCAVPVVSASWIGLSGFAESFLFRAPVPQRLLCPWQWFTTGAAIVGLVSRLSALRKSAGPAEQLQARSRLTRIDHSHIRGPLARLAARGDAGRLEVADITLALPSLPPTFDGLRVAHLSDLHYGGEISEALTALVIQEVEAAAPDLIVFTGDLATFERDIERGAEALASMPAPLGTYVVLGNHDFWTDAQRTHTALVERGVCVLRNQGVRLQRGPETIWLAGVDDYWSPTCDLGAALAARGEGEFCLLLAHNPDQVIAASRQEVDLQLSGHTHGGQVALPILGPLMVPSEHGRRFAHGLHKVGGTLLYVSRGLGAHPPIRIGSVLEVILLTLRCRGVR